jgi:hypothetical protein
VFPVSFLKLLSFYSNAILTCDGKTMSFTTTVCSSPLA